MASLRDPVQARGRGRPPALAARLVLVLILGIPACADERESRGSEESKSGLRPAEASPIPFQDASLVVDDDPAYELRVLPHRLTERMEAIATANPSSDRWLQDFATSLLVMDRRKFPLLVMVVGPDNASSEEFRAGVVRGMASNAESEPKVIELGGAEAVIVEGRGFLVGMGWIEPNAMVLGDGC